MSVICYAQILSANNRFKKHITSDVSFTKQGFRID
jgi:hypothetical protein